jgi:hypothetical protein
MSNDKRTCAFVSNECNGKINKVGDRVSIPKTNINLISYRMFLCMFHYNKFIINENYKLEKMLQICSHPKHEFYLSQSNKQSKQKQKPKLINISKRLINMLKLEENSKICSRCIKNTDKDPEYCKLKNIMHQFQKKVNSRII